MFDDSSGAATDHAPRPAMPGAARAAKPPVSTAPARWAGRGKTGFVAAWPRAPAWHGRAGMDPPRRPRDAAGSAGRSAARVAGRTAGMRPMGGRAVGAGPAADHCERNQFTC